MARLPLRAFTAPERCKEAGTWRALARQAIAWLGYLLDLDRARMARSDRRRR
jgi:hypothetical protein